MKDLGELRQFLRIEIARSENGLVLCQRKYVLELTFEEGLAGGKVARIPMELNLKPTTRKYDEHLI